MGRIAFGLNIESGGRAAQFAEEFPPNDVAGEGASSDSMDWESGVVRVSAVEFVAGPASENNWSNPVRADVSVNRGLDSDTGGNGPNRFDMSPFGETISGDSTASGELDDASFDCIQVDR